MGEVWREMAGFPRYEISDHGSIRIAKTKHISRLGAVLKTRVAKTGYETVLLYVGAKGYVGRSVHRLVLASFVGEPPTPQHQAAHSDGDRLNNRLDNLRWATVSENLNDKKVHGTETNQKGEANYRAKLTSRDVMEIRSHTKRYGIGVALAEKYGVTPQAINKILSGEAWTHV